MCLYYHCFRNKIVLSFRHGSTKQVKTILEYRKANIDVMDKNGDPSHVFAWVVGSLECVHIIIKRNANVWSWLRDDFGLSVAHIYAYHGQPSKHACLLKLYLNVASSSSELIR